MIEAVLFDIDDTLVDLKAAMRAALVEVTRLASFPAIDPAVFERFYRHFVKDPGGFYDRFLQGSLTFEEQRVERLRSAAAAVGISRGSEEDLEQWNLAYEKVVPTYWRAFDGVYELLDGLDAAGIIYGAVSNNTVERQRQKLDMSGLSRVKTLVGTDTVGVAKPDPRIFQAACTMLGVSESATLYVGDNWTADVQGSLAAGLRPLWFAPAKYAWAQTGPGTEPGVKRVGDLREVLVLSGGIG